MIKSHGTPMLQMSPLWYALELGTQVRR